MRPDNRPFLILNEEDMPLSAAACETLQNAKFHISSQVHSTGLCHLSVFVAPQIRPGHNESTGKGMAVATPRIALAIGCAGEQNWIASPCVGRIAL